MIRLALLRHGHTAWNRAGRIQGCTDIPLDPEAERHLARLCLPENWQTAALVASPLARALRTAELVARRAAEPVPALTEMNWGLWEGRKGTSLRADTATGFRDIEDWGWTYRPPEGESPGELRDRLRPWVAGLRADTLAVCHIGVMRVLMALATGWAFAGPCPFSVKRDRLYIVEVSGADWQLLPDPVRLGVRAS